MGSRRWSKVIIRTQAAVLYLHAVWDLNWYNSQDGPVPTRSSLVPHTVLFMPFRAHHRQKAVCDNRPGHHMVN